MNLGPLMLNIIVCATACAGDGAADPYDFERARARVLRSALASAEPSIVTIETIGGAQPLAQPGPDEKVREEAFRLADGPTTGLVLSADGLIITSSVNFAREPSIITVMLADGQRHVATLLARDHIRRLALLKVDATDLPAPTWAPASELQVGQYAMACGRALGGERPSLSMGIISALGRRNGNAVQTDAKVSPVNYGGPLIDIEGRVIGLLVPMAGAGGALVGAEWYDSGIGFAIGKEKIDLVLDRLVAGQSIEQGKIGVVLVPDEPSLIPLLDKLLPSAKGVKIGTVAPKSPASKAKLRSGDKILAIDGAATGDLMTIKRRLSDRAAGERITLTIKRRWRTFDVELKLVAPSEIGKVEPDVEDDDAREGG